MPLPDDPSEIEEWDDGEIDHNTLWVSFEPTESLWLELPDGSIHEFWPGFGFTK